MTEKRPRGRPPGTGKKDDQHLAKIADLMVAHGIKMQTSAMRRYIRSGQYKVRPTEEESTVRRWQDKWQKSGGSFLDAARLRAQSAENVDIAMHAIGWFIDAIASSSDTRKNWLDIDLYKQESPIAKFMRELGQPSTIGRAKNMLSHIRSPN